MTLPQTHITASTPMGATLIPEGATFRVWAQHALEVHLAVDPDDDFTPSEATALAHDAATGHWTGFAARLGDGTRYLFYVVGSGSSGFKRDPWAREIGGSYPEFVCVARAVDAYPWHDQAYRTPDFADLVVYQFHVGVWSARDTAGQDLRPGRVAKLLDALDRAPYLAALGVNAVQPLPLVEFRTGTSLGYNGTDIFSPEADYCVDPADLAPYLTRVNALLAQKGQPALSTAQLTGHVNQLKAFVDVLHLYGIAVIMDVVYNHAGDGSGSLDDQGLDWFDRPAGHGPDDNAYFGTGEWIGKVFKYPAPEVASFLIRNALLFLVDYHADGLRFDEVRVIGWNGGRRFLQDLTRTLRWTAPRAVLIAEFWDEPRASALWAPPDGLGFDVEYGDRLRDSVRAVLAEAAAGAAAAVDLARLGDALTLPWGVPAAWQVYNYLENHDLELDQDGEGHRTPRIARLAGGNQSRSWYARSRSRVATGLLLTAPGIPALFMGQEFLEDKLWTDDVGQADHLIWWAGAEGVDPVMVDFLRCTTDLVALRRAQPGLRSSGLNVFHVNPDDRVLAFHRWVPQAGHDVLVVASLREQPFEFGSYQLGFPRSGRWTEALNTDAYESTGQPWVQTNAAGVLADGPPLHGLPYSAGITIPANGLIVLTPQ
jgi:1,4-alpha-glucan branching enzyme